MVKNAVFQGLIFDEQGRQLDVAFVGDSPCYVIEDDGFKRHIDAEQIDRQIIHVFSEQALSHRELLTAKMMEMMGKDDVFTKAMIEESFSRMDQLLNTGLPEDTRDMLGMVGFRVVIDVHGEIVEIKMPAQPESWDE